VGVAGIIAIVSIVVLGWKINPMFAALGAVVMIVLMVVLVIFARLSTAPTIEFKFAIQAFMWASLVLTISAALLLFTSVFFSKPINFRGDPDPAVAAGYHPTKADRKIWQLEEGVNRLRGTWETVSYFGKGQLSNDVLERATKLNQQFSAVDDKDLGPSGHVIKREYLCYSSIMEATTEEDLGRRSQLAKQAIEQCHSALDDLNYMAHNSSLNSNLRYTSTWAIQQDQEPFTYYLLAIAACIYATTTGRAQDKAAVTSILNNVPTYYLNRYPPAHDWILKTCYVSKEETHAQP